MKFEKEFNKFVVKFLSEKKLVILNALSKVDCMGLNPLSLSIGSYSALVGFYLNGNESQPNGLIEMGLVEKFVTEDFLVRYRITEFGLYILNNFKGDKFE